MMTCNSPTARLVDALDDCEQVIDMIRSAAKSVPGPQPSPEAQTEAVKDLDGIRRQLCYVADRLDESAERESKRR